MVHRHSARRRLLSRRSAYPAFDLTAAKLEWRLPPPHTGHGRDYGLQWRQHLSAASQRHQEGDARGWLGHLTLSSAHLKGVFGVNLGGFGGVGVGPTTRLSENVLCRSLSSIHVHYNHTPSRAVRSLPPRCAPFLISFGTEVVYFTFTRRCLLASTVGA